MTKKRPQQPLLPPQLQSVLNDVRRCFEAKLYYPALLVALTLPEVCITLAFPGKETHVKEDNYEAWIDKYVPPDNLGLGGKACYRLRCGVVHRGDAAGHKYFGSKNVIFTVPETGGQIHGIQLAYEGAEEGDNILSLSLQLFLGAMEAAVLRWHLAEGGDPVVQQNLANLLSWRSQGLPPLFRGGVIASGPT